MNLRCTQPSETPKAKLPEVITEVLYACGRILPETRSGRLSCGSNRGWWSSFSSGNCNYCRSGWKKLSQGAASIATMPFMAVPKSVDGKDCHPKQEIRSHNPKLATCEEPAPLNTSRMCIIRALATVEPCL